MRAIIIFGFPLGIGGHYKSSLAFFQGLKSYNYKFYLLISEESNTEMISYYEEICENIHYTEKMGYSKYLMNSLIRKRLNKIFKEKEYDVIFAQDFVAMVASLASSLKYNIPVIFTKAGGPINQYFPPKQMPTIVFSEELREGLQKEYNHNPNKIKLIKERIDTGIYKPQKINKTINAGYKIPINDNYNIFMAVRFENAKMSYIKGILELINSNKNFFKNTNLILAGDGSKKNLIIQLVNEINNNFGHQVVNYIGKITNTEHLVNIYNYVDIAIGSGRGILEPMACGKPVILAADKNLAVEVDESNFDTIMHWNCSIRGLRKLNNTYSLLHVIKKAKNNRADKSSLMMKLVKENYDVKEGVKKLHVFVVKNIQVPLNKLKVTNWIIKYKILYLKNRLKRKLYARK